MNREERERLRALAANPLFPGFAQTVFEANGWWCYIERRRTPIPYRIGRAVLFGFDGRAAVFRRYAFEIQAARREEDIAVGPEDVARLLARLVRIGLWELSDFIPYAPIIDGGAHVVRAVGMKDPMSFLDRPVADACLACPEYAISRDVRRVGRAFDRLLDWSGPPRTVLGHLRARLGLD